MDGQQEYFGMQRVEEVQGSGRPPRRKRNSYSRIFQCIISCLIGGRHKHMLEFRENRNEFLVTLKNKKSKEWQKSFISFFKELDDVFKDRDRSKGNYEEDAKGRFRANISKLKKSGYIKETCWWKERKSTTKHVYKILCPKALAEVQNSSSEVNHVSENANSIFIAYMDASNLLAEDATAHARLDIDGDHSPKNFVENQIPLNGEEENQAGEYDLGENIVISEFFQGDNFDIKVGNEVVENTSNSLNVKNGNFFNDTEGSIVTLGNVAHFAENVSFMDGSLYQYEDISEKKQILINENSNSCLNVMNDGYVTGNNASITELSYQNMLQYPELLEQNKNDTSFSGNFDMSNSFEDDNLSLLPLSPLLDFEMDIENGSEDWLEIYGRISPPNE